MSAPLTYRVVSTLQTPTKGDLTALSISPEGRLIAAGSADGHVFVWCLHTFKLLCQTSPPPNERGATDADVTNMTWMPDGLLVFSRKNGLMSMLLVGKCFIEAVSVAVHDCLPVLAMAYTDALKCWATATHNEINFVHWRRSDWHTFYMNPDDRIVAKRVIAPSEEERSVVVTSLNWIKKSSNAAHLLVSFLHHHVEIIDGETKNVLTRVAIHTPVSRLCLSPDQRKALVTNGTGGLVVYDISSAEVTACVRDICGLDQTSPVTFAHGGRAIFVGCEGGRVELFDAGLARSLQTLDHEGGGNVRALAVRPSDDTDQSLVGTAISGNDHAPIFVWQAVRDGPNSGRSNIDNGTRRRILRVTLAWSTLIIAALARYYGRDGVYQLSEWVTGLSLRL